MEKLELRVVEVDKNSGHAVFGQGLSQERRVTQWDIKCTDQSGQVRPGDVAFNEFVKDLDSERPLFLVEEKQKSVIH